MNADTKAIVSVLRICNVDHDYQNIETMREEHKRNEEFAKVSPI